MMSDKEYNLCPVRQGSLMAWSGFFADAPHANCGDHTKSHDIKADKAQAISPDVKKLMPFQGSDLFVFRSPSSNTDDAFNCQSYENDLFPSHFGRDVVEAIRQLDLYLPSSNIKKSSMANHIDDFNFSPHRGRQRGFSDSSKKFNFTDEHVIKPPVSVPSFSPVSPDKSADSKYSKSRYSHLTLDHRYTLSPYGETTLLKSDIFRRSKSNTMPYKLRDGKKMLFSSDNYALYDQSNKVPILTEPLLKSTFKSSPNLDTPSSSSIDSIKKNNYTISSSNDLDTNRKFGLTDSRSNHQRNLELTRLLSAIAPLLEKAIEYLIWRCAVGEVARELQESDEMDSTLLTPVWPSQSPDLAKFRCEKSSANTQPLAHFTNEKRKENLFSEKQVEKMRLSDTVLGNLLSKNDLLQSTNYEMQHHCDDIDITQISEMDNESINEKQYTACYCPVSSLVSTHSFDDPQLYYTQSYNGTLNQSFSSSISCSFTGTLMGSGTPGIIHGYPNQNTKNDEAKENLFQSGPLLIPYSTMSHGLRVSQTSAPFSSYGVGNTQSHAFQPFRAPFTKVMTKGVSNSNPPGYTSQFFRESGNAESLNDHGIESDHFFLNERDIIIEATVPHSSAFSNIKNREKKPSAAEHTYPYANSHIQSSFYENKQYSDSSLQPNLFGKDKSIYELVKQLSWRIPYHIYSPIVFISAIVYLGRLTQRCCHHFSKGLNENNLGITHLNWYRLSVMAILVATKMYLDGCHKLNTIFSLSSGIPIEEISRMEIDFLYLLDFDLIVVEHDLEEWINWMGRVSTVLGYGDALYKWIVTTILPTSKSLSRVEKVAEEMDDKILPKRVSFSQEKDSLERHSDFLRKNLQDPVNLNPMCDLGSDRLLFNSTDFEIHRIPEVRKPNSSFKDNNSVINKDAYNIENTGIPYSSSRFSRNRIFSPKDTLPQKKSNSPYFPSTLLGLEHQDNETYYIPPINCKTDLKNHISECSKKPPRLFSVVHAPRSPSCSIPKSLAYSLTPLTPPPLDMTPCAFFLCPYSEETPHSSLNDAEVNIDKFKSSNTCRDEDRYLDSEQNNRLKNSESQLYNYQERIELNVKNANFENSMHLPVVSGEIREVNHGQYARTSLSIIKKEPESSRNHEMLNNQIHKKIKNYNSPSICDEKLRLRVGRPAPVQKPDTPYMECSTLIFRR